MHIIDGLALGGAQQIMATLVTELRERNYEITVVTLSRSTVPQPYETVLHDAGIEVIHCPKKTKTAMHLFHDLTDLMHTRHPDVVHTHLFASDVWGGTCAYRAHIPTISTEHNINNEEGKLKHFLKHRTHRYRHAVVAVSHAVAENIAARCPSAKSIIRVIPNGIDVKRFHGIQRTINTLPVISIVGRLEPQKGHADLLATLPLVTRPYQAHIYGNGSLKKELTITIAQLRLSDRVQVHESVHDIEQIYAQSDIVVVPSRWEGFGLVAVEAMAAGCAVVVSDVDGLKEVVTHNTDGLRVNMRDHEAVAKVLNELLANPQLRARLGAAAQQTVTQHYSRSTMLNAYDALYQDLL